ncbi:nucleotide kinase domain-containing protein, partial [Kribbella sp. CCNWLY201]
QRVDQSCTQPTQPELPGVSLQPVADANCRRSHSALRVTVSGRELETTPVFDTYWRFAAARQAAFLSRIAGTPAPWTDDPIISAYRFTNCYRVTDRVSQYLIRNVIYTGSEAPDELAFRILLFKFFNKIETWQALVAQFGAPTLASFDVDAWADYLSNITASGATIYSAAYVIPPPPMGKSRKHANHLLLLDHMVSDGIVDKLQAASSMHDAFEWLRSYPGIGDFLAFQYLIDLNYSPMLSFDEMDYVVAGPGAKDGIRKCFAGATTGIEREIIQYMADSQEEQFNRLGLRFGKLRGRRLQLIDCQNLFCETDKYARVAHPDIKGISGRTRIKQSFRVKGALDPMFYPPKWGIG